MYKTNSEVGARLVEYIEYKGMSVNSFEKQWGVSKNYIKNIVRYIKPEYLDLLVEKYSDIDLNWLFSGRGQMLKENISENSANLSKQTISKDRNNIDEVITNKINDIIMENIPTIITATIDGIAKVILPQIEGNQKTIEKQLDMLSEAMKMLADINRKSDDIRENVVKLTRKTG